MISLFEKLKNIFNFENNSNKGNNNSIINGNINVGIPSANTPLSVKDKRLLEEIKEELDKNLYDEFCKLPPAENVTFLGNNGCKFLCDVIRYGGKSETIDDLLNHKMTLADDHLSLEYARRWNLWKSQMTRK